MTFFAPVPWEADKFYAQPGMAERNLTLNYWPVGTGPYMLTEYQENRRHVLERNPELPRRALSVRRRARRTRRPACSTTAASRRPSSTRSSSRSRRSGSPHKDKFLQGLLRHARRSRASTGSRTSTTTSTNSEDDAPSCSASAASSCRRLLEISNWYLGFNWSDPVVGKGKHAGGAGTQPQAAPGAVDRDRLGRVTCASSRARRRASRAMSAVPPGVCSATRHGARQSTRCSRRRRRQAACASSIEEAKQLLAEAGYPDGRDAKTGQPLVLNYDYQRALTPELKAEVDWMVKQFAKIGVQLEVRATDYNRFQDKARQGQPADLLVGLARRLSGRRELPVPAVRPELARRHAGQRREHRQLPEPGVRQAVRRAAATSTTCRASSR